jgi:hypothetical protein
MDEDQWFERFQAMGAAEVQRRFEEHDFDDYDAAMDAAATWLRKQRYEAPQRLEALQTQQADAAERGATAAEDAVIEARRANRIARKANTTACAAVVVAIAAITLSLIGFVVGQGP